MKTKEYITHFKMNEEGNKLNRDEFVIELEKDFISSLKAIQGDKKELGLMAFQSVVKQIRLKWDSIFLKTKFPKIHSDKFWGFFFASVILKHKKERFPELVNIKPKKGSKSA